jgi:TonB family protein
MRLPKLLSWTVLFGTSLGVHAVGFAKLNHLGGEVRVAVANKPAFVEMTSVPKAALPPEPTPTAEKPAPKAVRRMAAAAPRVRAEAPAQARPSATPPAAETPADFSGTTLTNNGPGPDWTSATGNGAAMHGPVGRPGALVTGRHVDGASNMPRPTGPVVVAVADLSRRPEAPALQDLLERNYPAEARQTGQPGKAVIRTRIMPDGSVRDMVVLSESGPLFGRACRDTLSGSRWTPPLDKTGHAVATVINYTCRFEVR